MRTLCILTVLLLGFETRVVLADVGGMIDLSTLRDPFKKPDIHVAVAKKEIKLGLERFPVESYKLIGIVTGPDRMRAMISAPDGKSYFVAEKSRIGVNNGIVTKITPDKIQIRENVTNFNGEKENINSEILFKQKEIGK